MRRLSGRYAQYFNAKTNRSGPLWQSRFFSCALSPQHLTVALRYVEQNPVRAFIVEKPAEHRWSSAEAHLAGELGPMLDEGDWSARGGVAGWAELLAEQPRQPIVHLLKRCTYGGRPFGDEAFVAEVEARLGHHWRRWPFEQELRDSEVELSLEALSPRICRAAV
jgi:putative transposase